MSLQRTCISLSTADLEAIKRRAESKGVSASEIVRQTLHECDWYIWDQREQELIEKLEAKNEQS